MSVCAADDMITSADSAFGSCELEQDAGNNSSTADPLMSNGRKKFGTVARCDCSTTVKALSNFASALGNGVRFEPFTDSQKSQWLLGGSDRGFIRLYDPTCHLRRSVVLPCTTDTSAKQICLKLKIRLDSVHLQLGGDVTRRLEPEECPLRIQNDFLETIGHADRKKRREMGDSIALGYLIRLFVGRPQSIDLSEDFTLSTYCDVRKGRLLQKWSRRLCKLNNDVDSKGEIEVVNVSKYKVELGVVRSRGRVMKLTQLYGSHHVYMAFESADSLNEWMAKCSKVSAKSPPLSDLSNRHLEYLPEEIFSLGSERMLTQLNVRRNRLRQRPMGVIINKRIGWLDDLIRLQSLRTLNLADNDLKHFPPCLLQLNALTELTISGNHIAQLPNDVGLLANLSTLNLSNNHLSWLPIELSECAQLTTIDLSFNAFTQTPDALLVLTNVKHWTLAGNLVQQLTCSLAGACIEHVQKIDLRRNALCESIEFGPRMSLNNLTHLDLRDNCDVKELDLRGLQSLQVLQCDRMCLTSLQINGTSLQAVYANQNIIVLSKLNLAELDQMIIMPVPLNLRTLEVSNNRLTALPEWLAELPNIEKICADHNYLKELPCRLFCDTSNLRTVAVHHNFLQALPDQIENCALEILLVHHNRITNLPHQLLSSAHRLRVLNATQNFLTGLPQLSPYPDLNKLQYLRLAANYCTASVVKTIAGCRRLRLLDLSCNRLKHFDDSNLNRLSSLEVLNLSGNRLTSLPDVLTTLPKLQVLRSHSNCLISIPDLSQAPKLEVLDLANNNFETLDVRLCLAENLCHLDLTCNTNTKIDKTFLESYELCIAQIRPGLSNNLFGIVDGGLNDEIPLFLQEKLPEIVDTQLTTCSTDSDVLKYAILEAHQSLKTLGQTLGAAVAIVRVTENQASPVGYNLSTANVGHVEAVLCRDGKPILLTESHQIVNGQAADEYKRIRQAHGIVTEANEVNGVTCCSRMIGCSFLYPIVVPCPHVTSRALTEDDEFLVIASKGLWERMSPVEVVRRVRPITNPFLAAKHLQDVVQAYDATGNISVMVVRLFFKSAIWSSMTQAEIADIPIPMVKPAFALASRPPVQSETHLYDSEETLSDSDVQSEPNGRPPKEKPNYYFEYKKKLKELMIESDSCFFVNNQELKEGEQRCETPIVISSVDGIHENGTGPLNALNKQANGTHSDALSELNVQQHVENGISPSTSAPKMESFTTYQLVMKRRAMFEGAKTPNGYNTGPNGCGDDRETAKTASRQRYDHAKQCLMQKLQLKPPKT